MPTSLVNPVIKQVSTMYFLRVGEEFPPPPLSFDPKGCGFKRMSENGWQAELQQQEMGAAVGEAGR